ncbi:MAG: hypothetical protein ABIT76_01700 [Chthoniobacterales bacterium]
MKTSLIACATVFLGSAWSAFAWDFTPQSAVTFVDGPAQRHYSLLNDTRKVNFRIDGTTKVSGDAGKAEFIFTDLANATLKIALSPLNEKKPAFQGNIPVYLEAARKLLPEGSTEIIMASEADNVFPINQWTSHQFVFQYGYFGRPFRTSVTFLNYSAKDQWIVVLSAGPNEFEGAGHRTSRLLNTFLETDASYKAEDAPN